jgi:hypothetical protein
MGLSELTVALVALAEHGIPSDVQELLTGGSKRQGIRPGALLKALRAVASLPPILLDLVKALEASQELLVTSLHYEGNEYVENTHERITENRATLDRVSMLLLSSTECSKP